MLRRTLVALIGGPLILLGLFLLAELTVRVLGIEPREFRFAQRALDLDSTRVDPLLGPLPRPGFSGVWAGDFLVDVDERGFRTTPQGPHPGRTRVVFMGDSCTFAWGIDTDETYLTRLEERQQGLDPAPFEFVNAAFPGHSAVVGVHMLREIVLPLNPDLVVLGFGGNNAFRLATISDRERLESYEIRRWVLRSRLLHILAGWLADRDGKPFNPRDRAEINALPLEQLRRVAAPDEFAAALRTMVADARAAGARPVFMIFPRASSVSRLHRTEDNASGVRFVPLPAKDAPIDDRDMGMLEASCLDVRRARESIATIRATGNDWQVVYPDDPMVRAQIKNGADAFARGDLKTAWHTFNRALGLQRSSPLATYDRGVIAIMMGDTANGLRDLELADTLACNAFLHYNVLVWNLAVELGVPVVDLTLWFQSRDGEPLFIDPAHPNVEGQVLIADALWPVLTRLAEQATAPSPAASQGS